MSELCRRTRAVLSPIYLLPLLAAITTSITSAQGGSLRSMEWHGPNLVLRFSDSVSFQTDMVESDSNLTLRFAEPINIEGSREARRKDLVASFEDSGRTFRLVGDGRVGYSMLWGPFSHTLVVYTFDWDSLSFAEEQFHMGLLAIEQGLPDVATEYLSTARNSDTGLVAQRAERVLGLVYEQTGQDSLAALYLGNPQDADAWGARAAILRRSGDTAAAATAERQMAIVDNELPGLAGADVEPEPAGDVAEASGSSDFLTGWPGITLLVIAGLLILIIATMFARRPPKEAEKQADEGATAAPEHPPAPAATKDIAGDEGNAGKGEPSIEVSSPPPAPEEADRIIEKEIPKARSSSLHEIFSPASEGDRTSTALEGLDEEEESVDESPEPAEAEEVATTPAPSRASRQADALRNKVQGTTDEAPEPEEEPESPVASDDDESSIISDARKMNVSRDYIELRRRLGKMGRE